MQWTYGNSMATILDHTVWYEIIFQHLNGYRLANMQDIDKIPSDYCLAINS